MRESAASADLSFLLSLLSEPAPCLTAFAITSIAKPKRSYQREGRSSTTQGLIELMAGARRAQTDPNGIRLPVGPRRRLN